MAVAASRAPDFAEASSPLPFWFRNEGMAIAARMPMIRMTTSSSTRVNPSSLFSRLRMVVSTEVVLLQRGISCPLTWTGSVPFRPTSLQPGDRHVSGRLESRGGRRWTRVRRVQHLPAAGAGAAGHATAARAGGAVEIAAALGAIAGGAIDPEGAVVPAMGGHAVAPLRRVAGVAAGGRVQDRGAPERGVDLLERLLALGVVATGVGVVVLAVDDHAALGGRRVALGDDVVRLCTLEQQRGNGDRSEDPDDQDHDEDLRHREAGVTAMRAHQAGTSAVRRVTVRRRAPFWTHVRGA